MLRAKSYRKSARRARLSKMRWFRVRCRTNVGTWKSKYQIIGKYIYISFMSKKKKSNLNLSTFRKNDKKNYSEVIISIIVIMIIESNKHRNVFNSSSLSLFLLTLPRPRSAYNRNEKRNPKSNWKPKKNPHQIKCNLRTKKQLNMNSKSWFRLGLS